MKKDRDKLLRYLAKFYNDPSGDTTDFLKDVSRIKYVNKYINEYITTGVFKHRPCINIIVILNNVFGAVATNTALFYIIDTSLHAELNSVLMFLGLQQPEFDTYNKELYNMLNEKV